MKKKIIALICAICIVCGACVALVACNRNGGPNDFTVWIPAGDGDVYYDGYKDNPVVKYLSAKEWAGEKLNLEWQVPSADSAQDSIVNAFTSESYAEVIDASNLTNVISINELYEDDYILDLTPYIEQYMPNYKAFLEANPDLALTATNLMPDGTRKHLQLWCFQGYEDMWGGWMYRRDWIVKYGTNPSTNQPFSQVGAKVTVDGIVHTVGWEGKNKDGSNDQWFDDVYFPSWYDNNVKEWYLADVDPNWNGQVPVTIDDWEWMLGIFKKAIQQEGITDGYCMQLYYPGYYELGNLITSFGGGGGTWYTNSDKTKAEFGLTSNSFRCYMDLINDWYRDGYIDTAFDQNTDMFYQCDTKKVYSGRVGLWYGLNSALNDSMDNGKTNSAENGYTNGIVVFGAREPINTSRGTEAEQRKIPTVMYQTNREMRSFVITDKAKGKNLEALFTMMDYMYSDEGILLNSFGMTKTQYEEYKALTGKTDALYEEANGEIYTLIDGKVKYSEAFNYDTTKQDAARGSRLWGLQARKDYQYKDPEDTDGVTTQKSLDEFIFFRNKGEITKSMLAQLSIADSETFNAAKTQLRNYAAQNIPTYIRGNAHMTDAQWNAWCARLKAMKVNEATQIIQNLLDKLNGK